VIKGKLKFLVVLSTLVRTIPLFSRNQRVTTSGVTDGEAGCEPPPLAS